MRAARRTDAPGRRRGAEPGVIRRQARLLRAAGIAPVGDEVGREGRRATLRIHGVAARPGFVHPLGRPGIRELLAFVGPLATYGVRSIELARAVDDASAAVRLAGLQVPGVVRLYEQPEPPWLLRGTLPAVAVARLERAGAAVAMSGSTTRVEWPGETLADWMRFDGLLHEIGHHLIQHHTGKRTSRVMRTADHERRAQRFADACRRAWSARERPA